MQLTSGLSEPTRLDLLFSFTGFSFIANFLASSFRLKYDILMLLAGSFSIIISIFYIWYFIKKDYLKQYFPWFALLFTAFCGSIITALGRMHLNDHFGNEPYYSTISQLLQIGLIILTGKLILEFRESPKIFKKKFLVSILISIIIFQIIFLIPSYYSGWQRGEYYFDEKTEYVNCFLSSPELHCLEKYHTYPTNDLSMINYLITNNLSIFGETDFIQKNEFVSKNFYSKVLPYSTEYSNIIKLVNGKNPPNSSTYNLNEEFIEINGSFIVETNSIPEKLYLLLDKKPIFSTNNFEIIQNYDDFENKVKINWSTFFLSGYVKNGCHSINLVGHTDDTELILSSDFEICKTK